MSFSVKRTTVEQERKAFARWAKDVSEVYVAGTTDNAKQAAEDARELMAKFQRAFEYGVAVSQEKAYEAGAARAADIADDYNAVTGHGYRLGDCILGKMNIRDGKPRRNKPDEFRVERYIREEIAAKKARAIATQKKKGKHGRR